MTLFEMLARTTAMNPAAPALVSREGTLSYAELLALAERFAGGLTGLGIRKRARVGLLLPNCPAFPIAYFGAARAGAAVIPMNVLYRPDEVRYMLADAGIEALVTAEPFRPLVEALRPLAPGLKHVIMVAKEGVARTEMDFRDLCACAPPKPVKVRDGDTAVILYTSGTTGRPKGAMLTHANLVANAEACTRVLDVGPSDCFFTALPLFHAFAAMVCMVLPVYVGARMFVLDRFIPTSVIELLTEAQATLFAGVPAIFGLLVQLAQARRPDLPDLRICISGGAPLPPEVGIAFQKTYNVQLVEGYGLTEASPVVTVNPPFGINKPGSIGPALPGLELTIEDKDGKPLPQGVIGELCVKGPSVMRGYLNRPEETKEAIRGGRLHTGDLARLDEDGYVYIVGRKKELIIVAGLNVYPGEVERVLVEHPAVLEAAAFGIPDTTRGEAVWAAVVLRPEHQATDKEIQAFCRERLAQFKVPRGVEILTELPKNALGKVVRSRLQEAVLQRLDQGKRARIGVQ